MNKKKRGLIFGLLVCLLCLVFAIGCSGGGGGSGGSDNSSGNNNPPPIIAECPKTNFTKVQLGQEIFDSCSSGNTVSVLFEQENKDVWIVLKIHTAYASEPIFSYGFYLAYDSNAVRFVEYQPGEFLGLGSEITVQVVEMNASEKAAGTVFHGCDAAPNNKAVVMGHSRLGNDLTGLFVDATGDELGKLKFNVTDPQTEVRFVFGKTKIYKRLYAYSPPTEISACWPKRLLLLLQ